MFRNIVVNIMYRMFSYSVRPSSDPLICVSGCDKGEMVSWVAEHSVFHCVSFNILLIEYVVLVTFVRHGRDWGVAWVVCPTYVTNVTEGFRSRPGRPGRPGRLGRTSRLSRTTLKICHGNPMSSESHMSPESHSSGNLSRKPQVALVAQVAYVAQLRLW